MGCCRAWDSGLGEAPFDSRTGRLITGKKVLMVGWHPSVVNYAKYPGLTAEKLEASLRGDEAGLSNLGYEVQLALIHSADTAATDVAGMLKGRSFDVVLIGAGVRKDDEHFLVFERLINVVHEHAPHARMAFNTGPTDSAAAVQRWA
jgi:hypothetical protein